MSPPIRDWLTLWRVPGIGPANFAALSERFGDPGAALAAGERALVETGIGAPLARAIAQADPRLADPDLAWLEAADDHHILTWADPGYPPQLREAAAPPPVLFVVGDPEWLLVPQLAIVGSRSPTPAGLTSATEFARELAAAGLTITSGLALGIDAAAHRGALEAGGATVAVTATGPDRVYPARHRELAHAIAAQGALVTEFPVGTGPRRGHFPRRNRLIGALSLGTLVVEAGRRSGALITARLAAEQGREVFAIPGSIHNPMARGCHRLIRQGAKLVETAADVLEELAPLFDAQNVAVPAAQGINRSSGSVPGPTKGEDPEYRILLEAMGFDPVGIDELVERTGLTVESVSSMLLILELEGRVAMAGDGRYYRLTDH